MRLKILLFAIAIAPNLLIAQSSSNENSRITEYIYNNDTLKFIASCKTDRFEVRHGDFSVLKNNKAYIHGAYKDDLKIGVWLFLNENLLPTDTIDYNIIHSIPELEYKKVYNEIAEGVQCHDIYRRLSEMHIRYPELPKAQGLQGKVEGQFIINAENQVTNIKVLNSDNNDFESEVLYSLCNLKFSNSCKLNGESINYKVSFCVQFNFHNLTAQTELCP